MSGQILLISDGCQRITNNSGAEWWMSNHQAEFSLRLIDVLSDLSLGRHGTFGKKQFVKKDLQPTPAITLPPKPEFDEMNHRLRTPLHGLRSGIERLVAGDHGPLSSSARAELSTMFDALSRLEDEVGIIIDALEK